MTVTIGRRELLAALGGAAAAWYQAFHDGLRELGWIPGSNVSIEYRFADNDPGRLAALAHELVRLTPDAIFVPTRPALPTVKDATTTIPIVFVSLGDPIAEGWVASLARPGANLTGVAGLSPDLAGKRLELLHELVPSLATSRSSQPTWIRSTSRCANPSRSGSR
jgi:putative ABC transport system substrate-binding protein